MSALLRHLLLSACLVLALAPTAWGQENYPTTKADWIERLAKIHTPIGEDYGAMYHLEQQDDELIFQVLRDGWSRFNGEGVKSYLLAIVVDGKAIRPPDRNNNASPPQAGPTPHLLEILNLGMRDPKGEAFYAARHHLLGIAFADLRTSILPAELLGSPQRKPDEFDIWYQAASAKPLETVMRDGMRDYMRRLDTADEPTKRRMLEFAGEIPFKSGLSTTTDQTGKTKTTILTTSLIAMRRKAALETGLLDKWMQLATPNANFDIAAFAALNVLSFMPDQAYLDAHAQALHDVLARISENPKSPFYYPSGQYLGSFHQRWAVDLLLKRLVSDFQTDGLGGLLTSLTNVDDPRVIPTCIALLETGEMESWHEFQVNAVLRRLGGPTALRNQASWREWWAQHKGDYPAEVRDMPLPHIHSAAEQANVVLVRKTVTQIQIKGDLQRSYLLLTPGMLLPRAPQTQTATDSRPTVAIPDRPGLIVVFSDTDPNNRQVQEFWQQVVNKALANKYLVAVAMAPRWGSEKPYTWVTTANQARTPAAKFTVESFAADIVADVLARYPIHPQHIFLHGEGSGGLAAYSCALQPQSPFQGFSLLGAEFRSAQLPPMTAAKGRRFYIQASKEDKSVPYFLTTSAQSLLSKAGATVVINPISGEHTPRFNAAALDLLAKAVNWMESGK